VATARSSTRGSSLPGLQGPRKWFRGHEGGANDGAAGGLEVETAADDDAREGVCPVRAARPGGRAPAYRRCSPRRSEAGSWVRRYVQRVARAVRAPHKVTATNAARGAQIAGLDPGAICDAWASAVRKFSTTG